MENLNIIKKLDEIRENMGGNLIDLSVLFMLSLSNNNIRVSDYILNKHFDKNVLNILEKYDMNFIKLLYELCKCSKFNMKGFRYIYNLVECKIEIGDIKRKMMIMLFIQYNKLVEAKFIYRRCINKDISLDDLNMNKDIVLLNCSNLKMLKWILQITKMNLDDLYVSNDILYDLIKLLKIRGVSKGKRVYF